MTIHDGYYDYLRALTRDAPEVPMLRDAMITVRYQMRLLLREPALEAVQLSGVVVAPRLSATDQDIEMRNRKSRALRSSRRRRNGKQGSGDSQWPGFPPGASARRLRGAIWDRPEEK